MQFENKKFKVKPELLSIMDILEIHHKQKKFLSRLFFKVNLKDWHDLNTLEHK